MGIVFLALLVAVIVLAVKNSRLSDENTKLKQASGKQCKKCGMNLSNFPDNAKFCPSCGVDLINGSVNTSVPDTKPIVNNSVPSTVSNTPVVKKKNITIDEKGIKNSFILIAGALLIIISAIVLLTSTWNYSHDIFKTLIITFMFVVFLGSSYIAKDKLELNVISKVFLYIALAYLPLIFLSISLFSLLGDYLSIHGDGKYIYLTISSIILSFVYYFEMKKNKDVLISLYGNLFQLLSVIFLTLIFSNNIFVIIFVLSIYTLVYAYFNTQNNYYYSLKIDKVLLSIYTISFFSISVMSSIFNTINIFYILSLFIDIVITYFISVKLNNDRKSYNIIYPLLIIFICLNIPSLFNNKSMFLYLVFILIGSIFIFILDYINNNKVNILNYIYITVISSILYLISLYSCDSITLTLFLFGYLLLSGLYYKYLDNYRGMASCIIPITLLLIISHFTYYLGITNMFISIVFSIIFIISSLINIKDKIFKYTLNISSIVFMSIYYLIQVFVHLNNITLIYSIGMFGILFIIFALTKKSYYKIISYLYLNITSIYTLMLFDKINPLYGIYISLLIVFIIECINRFSDKAGAIYLLIQFILSFMCIFGFDNNLVLLLGIVLLFIINIYINKLDFKYNYIPLCTIGLFSLIHNNIYTTTMSIIIFVLLLLLTNINEKSIKDIPRMLYVFSVFIVFTNFNKYLSIILLIILFGYYLYLFKKDVFKFFLYICVTILLRYICVDIEIGKITLFNYGLYLILFVLCCVDIFRKHITWYKVLEYIGLILLYLTAMGNYLDSLDGLLFVCLILIITIFGYIRKYGPMFIVSLIFVLINMFYLTSEFWLAIPWWLYLLVVGIILILFAIYNEMNEKKNKNLLKEIVNKFNM